MLVISDNNDPTDNSRDDRNNANYAGDEITAGGRRDGTRAKLCVCARVRRIESRSTLRVSHLSGSRDRRAWRTSNGLDGIYGKKGCDREERGEKRQGLGGGEGWNVCGAPSAVGGCERDYGTVVRVA